MRKSKLRQRIEAAIAWPIIIVIVLGWLLLRANTLQHLRASSRGTWYEPLLELVAGP